MLYINVIFLSVLYCERVVKLQGQILFSKWGSYFWLRPWYLSVVFLYPGAGDMKDTANKTMQTGRHPYTTIQTWFRNDMGHGDTRDTQDTSDTANNWDNCSTSGHLAQSRQSGHSRNLGHRRYSRQFEHTRHYRVWTLSWGKLDGLYELDELT